MSSRSRANTSEPIATPNIVGIPKHRQISDEIRRIIRSGGLRPGDLLPSENVLTQKYGVARGTVRQALATLRADGTVAGSRGRPLAVQGGQLTQPLSELISFSAWIRAMGKVPSGKVVEFGSRPADARTAALLGVAPDSEVYHLVRVRFADDQALMIERTTFVRHVGELVALMDLATQSIYEELASRGVEFASARHAISAIPASRLDARLLDVAPRCPLLRIRRQAFARTGAVLEWSEDRYRADLVDFAIENTISGPGVIRRMA